MKPSTYLSVFSIIFLLSLSLFVSSASAAVKEFTDYDKDDFGYESVSYLVAEEVIFGLPGNIFAPDRLVSRAETAVMFQRALDLPSGGDNFADVPAGLYYTDAATAVKLEGIFKGKPGNIFGAEDILTREQMASVLVRAFDLKSTPTVPVNANDLGLVSSWHLDDVKTLYQNGVTNGKGNVYDPKGVVSRAEFSVFLHRALVGLGIQEPVTPPEEGEEVPPVIIPPGGEEPGPNEPVELKIRTSNLNFKTLDNEIIPAKVTLENGESLDKIKFDFTGVAGDKKINSGSITVSVPTGSTLTLNNIPMKDEPVVRRFDNEQDKTFNIIDDMGGVTMNFLRVIPGNFTASGTLVDDYGNIKNVQVEFILGQL